MSRSSDARSQHPALAATLRALRLDRRKPTEADRPPASTFPGRKATVLPGQLELADDAEPEPESERAA